MDIKQKIETIILKRDIRYMILLDILSKCMIGSVDGNDNYFYQGLLLFIYYPNKNILWYNPITLKRFYIELYKIQNNMEDYLLDDEIKNVIKYYFEEKYKIELELFY